MAVAAVTAWIFVIGTLLFLYAAVSKRLSTTLVTGPMLFVTVGLIIGSSGLGVLDVEIDAEAITLLFEATLALVLFSDAATINSSNWRKEAPIPGRLLSWGLLLTIVFGTAAAMVIFTDIDLWAAGLIAVILAPTDAALGQAVISNPRVPQSIRQALNVESGLNDGIALPIILVLLSAAEESASGISFGTLMSFIGQELLIAAAVGIAIGWIGATILVRAAKRGWVSPLWLQIGTLSLAAAAYSLAVMWGGSGFIAVWLAGLVLGRTTRGKLEEVSGFSETLGSALTMTSFLVFGAFILGTVLGDLTWQIAVYAVLSLTVIRMIPVALAMIGSGLNRVSVLYLGWFGPRGLASIIFAGLVIEGSEIPHASLIVTVAMVTVGVSVYAHGATSWIGSESYANWWERHEAITHEPAEKRTVPHVSVPQRSRAVGMARADDPPAE
jgi:NhaP-type Na+/H+ or K+/H+ antiporter